MKEKVSQSMRASAEKCPTMYVVYDEFLCLPSILYNRYLTGGTNPVAY